MLSERDGPLSERDGTLSERVRPFTHINVWRWLLRNAFHDNRRPTVPPPKIDPRHPPKTTDKFVRKLLDD